MPETSPSVMIQPFGEAALMLSVDVALATQRRLWATWHALCAREPQVEWVLGMGNLTGFFDPLAIATTQLERAIEAAWLDSNGAETEMGKRVEIPVVYGGEAGPDLAVVAEQAGLSCDEVIARHAAGEYVVYCLGFLPGFAYLGGLDPALACPRRASPRLSVPAGSVAIGGAQTAVYPLASPGGWQLIGRTDVKLFDPYRETPGLLSPGDTVVFVPRPA
ncbi:5-oxoprolinase subunit PxpB [Jeongeupia naejangsanensis]|uniref:5-oxoprolinase subunit PxpB n=2 Tax=Jeongeupia naejangsanensis TaxID=613195 RepID=A0ABS2BM89_9NEIS|nr:5-oxoprolinase subunit PxpB [Jeongeupia naejangsanensis]